jgi:hypothetical protein
MKRISAGGELIKERDVAYLRALNSAVEEAIEKTAHAHGDVIPSNETLIVLAHHTAVTIYEVAVRTRSPIQTMELLLSTFEAFTRQKVEKFLALPDDLAEGEA